MNPEHYPKLRDYLTASELGSAHKSASESTYFGIHLADLTREELLVLIWLSHEEARETEQRNRESARTEGWMDGMIQGIKRKGLF